MQQPITSMSRRDRPKNPKQQLLQNWSMVACCRRQLLWRRLRRYRCQCYLETREWGLLLLLLLHKGSAHPPPKRRCGDFDGPSAGKRQPRKHMSSINTSGSVGGARSAVALTAVPEAGVAFALSATASVSSAVVEWWSIRCFRRLQDLL